MLAVAGRRSGGRGGQAGEAPEAGGRVVVVVVVVVGAGRAEPGAWRLGGSGRRKPGAGQPGGSGAGRRASWQQGSARPAYDKCQLGVQERPTHGTTTANTPGEGWGSTPSARVGRYGTACWPLWTVCWPKWDTMLAVVSRGRGLVGGRSPGRGALGAGGRSPGTMRLGGSHTLRPGGARGRAAGVAFQTSPERFPIPVSLERTHRIPGKRPSTQSAAESTQTRLAACPGCGLVSEG
ncbi:hypothetical protein HNR67_003631 [Crossiella cryophila]|uniref:Uncharacterized protein n=1 Tax=Crossiella cryophila TaxID=43355 RepID=A0A7W7FUJ4_9PSEU|nr:hypothetical protein [Crossiella cryophila]